MERTAQLDRTRQAIIEAALEIFTSEADPGELTMQAVADRAGVSHRTVYRHFVDRQALIDAVGRHIDQGLEGSSEVGHPADFDAWINGIEATAAFGATHRETLRRVNLASFKTGVWRSDRDERYWSLFRARFPDLPESEARQDFAMLRHLLGAANVIGVGERFGLSPDQVAAGTRRAVEALVAAIAIRDRAAGEEPA
jgi:AcrR family transcriptional regulator